MTAEEIIDAVFAVQKMGKLTNRMICEELGVSHHTLCKWKKGIHSPSLSNLVALCDLIGVTLQIKID